MRVAIAAQSSAVAVGDSPVEEGPDGRAPVDVATAAPGADGAGGDVGVDEVGEDAPAEQHADVAPADLMAPPAVPDELERRLNEDEEMERRTRQQHHEAPHFRKESD